VGKDQTSRTVWRPARSAQRNWLQRSRKHSQHTILRRVSQQWCGRCRRWESLRSRARRREPPQVHPQGPKPRGLRDLRVCQFRHTGTSSVANPGKLDAVDVRSHKCYRATMTRSRRGPVEGHRSVASGVERTRGGRAGRLRGSGTWPSQSHRTRTRQRRAVSGRDSGVDRWQTSSSPPRCSGRPLRAPAEDRNRRKPRAVPAAGRVLRRVVERDVGRRQEATGKEPRAGRLVSRFEPDNRSFQRGTRSLKLGG